MARARGGSLDARLPFLLAVCAAASLAAGSAAAASPQSAPRPQVYQRGLEAYAQLEDAGRVRNPLLTLIDYALPSSQQRLWVIEPASGAVLFREFVAHGRGSADPVDPDRAVAFGNEVGSHRSSLGAFLTGETYRGAHGYSLELEGLEPGVNDLASLRRIVIHPADYVTRSFLRQNGRLGRSHGCPALDPAVSARIIDRIRSGSVLFAAGPDPAQLFSAR